MAEYTDDDVGRLAAMLSDAAGAWTHEACARRLLEQGVTLPDPPPDPAVVVAEVLVRNAWPSTGWHGDSDPDSGQARFITGLRDLVPPEALAAAAAKVQEADRG